MHKIIKIPRRNSPGREYMHMRFIFLTIVSLFYLVCQPCFGLCLDLTHKLAIDKLLEKVGLENLHIIESEFIHTNLVSIDKNVFDSLKEVSEQEGSKFTLQKYKTKIQSIAEALLKEIRDSLDKHVSLSGSLADELHKINVEIVNNNLKSRNDDLYRQRLLEYLNSEPFGKNIQYIEESINKDNRKLIGQLSNILHLKHESQNDILNSIILLHKLAIEIELTKIVYLNSKNRTKSSEFESKLQNFLKMLHLLKNFEQFLTGCFNSPYEIFITKIINLDGISQTSNSTDTRFIIYPNLKFDKELCKLTLLSKIQDEISSSNETKTILVDNGRNPVNFDKYIGNQSEIAKKVEISDRNSFPMNNPNISQSDLNSLNSSKPNQDHDITHNDRVKVEIDIISPILSVELHTTPKIEDANKNESLTKNYNMRQIEKVPETTKINDEEVKSHITKRNFKQIHKYKINEAKKTSKNSKLDFENSKKCFEFHYVCLLVRHLDDDEIMELDKDLFSYQVKLPMERDSNLIWSVSESLVDYFGARKRLIEHVSQKIIDFTLSIDRLNTDPLMNTGDQKNDQLGFYREKHFRILSILISLKEFLNSKDSKEISIARLNFIDKFVPLVKRPSISKFKFSQYSEYKDEKSRDSLLDRQASNKIIKLTSAFENGSKYKYSLENELISPKIDETINEPSLFELCTRFVTILSVTKSVKSFNDNSFKFAQKVCSMIFEQPIHNILSSQDYAWLTGFTLVKTVNSLIRQRNLPEEIFIDHKNALRALNHSFSQKAYNFHQACTQSLISQKSTAIYQKNISLHHIKPIMKVSCAEYFGISVFLYEN